LNPRSLHRWYYATHRYPGKKDRKMHMAWRCTESPINSPVSISLLGNDAVNSSSEIAKKGFGPQTEEGKARALANLRAPWRAGQSGNPGGHPKPQPRKRMGSQTPEEEKAASGSGQLHFLLDNLTC